MYAEILRMGRRRKDAKSKESFGSTEEKAQNCRVMPNCRNRLRAGNFSSAWLCMAVLPAGQAQEGIWRCPKFKPFT